MEQVQKCIYLADAAVERLRAPEQSYSGGWKFVLICEFTRLWQEQLEIQFLETFKHFFFHIYLFRLCHVACGILNPWPGIKLVPYALGVSSLNHWTVREVPSILTLL